MARRIWLIFAQACTVSVAVLFVISTLRPDWLSRGSKVNRNPVVFFQETGNAGRAATMTSYSDAVRRAMPAVVSITTRKEVRPPNPFMEDPVLRRFFGDMRIPGRQVSSEGSGVIVSSQGYVLTNNHVVAGAEDIELILADGRKLPAKVIGSDPESDLAVLKLDAQKLPTITFGTEDQLQVGDVVLAIGNPFGFGGTVTSGIVSAMGRSHLDVNTIESYIQTDAAINPGNSGGALVDASGNLVGINSSIYSKTGSFSGIGFAIPVSLAKNVLEQIVKTGKVTRSWIGVDAEDVTPETAKFFGLSRTSGALVRDVPPGAPAAKAGVQLKDIIVEFNGKPATDRKALRSLIATVAPGERAPMKVIRGDQELVLSVEVATLPPPDAAIRTR